MSKDPVEFNKRKTKPIRPLVERMVYGQAQGAEKADAERIRKMYAMMLASQPEALAKTKLFVGRPKGDNVVNQLHDTQSQDSFVGDISGIRNLIASYIGNMTDTGLEQFPSSYFGVGDFAVLPEASPGVAMHEAGHAIDLNRPRMGGNFRRDMAMRYKPTLIQEHAAWRRGEKALAHGAAMGGKDEDKELAREVLRDAYFRKRPALGTYWGAGLGTLLGIGGGIGLAELAGRHDSGLDGYHFPAGVLGALVGGTTGLLSGAGLGKLISSDKGADRYAEKRLKKGEKKVDKE